MARTNSLPNFLTDVADAIREKKGTEETIQASDFDTEIVNLPSGGDLSDYFETTINNTLNNSTIPAYVGFIKKIPDITVSDNVTKIEGVFANFTGLTEIGKITFGSNVTSIYGFFSYCQNLTSLDLSGFDTSEVTNLAYVFNGCSKLTSLDLSNFYTSKVTTMNSLFKGCKLLKKIDMRNMTFDTVEYYNNMFDSSASNGVPNNCEIIVKSQTEKDWITSNFSRLTNVKTVAEYEAE